jgi:FkbM family methyltransferase
MTSDDQLPGLIEMVTGRYGNISYFSSDNVIGASLRAYGEWAQHELDLLLSLLHDGDCVVDVGAFIGTHTLAFAQRVGKSGSVHSFEPNPYSFRLLDRNVGQNGLSNVKLYNCAVSNSTGSFDMPHSLISVWDKNNPGALSLPSDYLDKHAAEASGLTRIKVTTLDGSNIKNCAMLKIDAEGKELCVLEGAQRLVSEQRPLIFAECLAVENGSELLTWIKGREYAVFLLNAPAYNPENVLGNPENLFGTARESSLLFVPNEKLSNIFQQTAPGFRLIPIRTLDDLVLGLLEKPQYKGEILAKTEAASITGTEFWLNEPEREEMERQVQQLQTQLTDKEQVARKLHLQKVEDEETIRAVNQQLNDILLSKRWQLMLLLSRIWVKLIPQGSTREKAVMGTLRWLLAGLRRLASGIEASSPSRKFLQKVATSVSFQAPASVGLSVEAKSDLIPVRIPKHPLVSAELAVMLEKSVTNTSYVLSISHDDYTQSIGGVQIMVSDEQLSHNARGISYLHLYPYTPRPTLSRDDEPFYIGINCDGRMIGVAQGDDLFAALAQLRDKKLVNIYIHHTMGFNLVLLNRILSELGGHQGRFWLHDNYSICPSYYLLRNDTDYCGAPSPDSNACFICSYGNSRKVQQSAFQKLFDENQLEVIAPSDFSLRFWKQKTKYPVRASQILPHAKLEWKRNTSILSASPGLRVAHVGYPVHHKGWKTWLSLANRFSGDSRYLFFLFSSTPAAKGNYSRVDVSIDPRDRFAMVKRLSEKEIDIAILWSLCPETFSFSMHEALAAGCFIITNKNSGNIQDYISLNPDRGLVLNDEEALFDLFSSDRLPELLSRYHKDGRPQADIVLLQD